MPSPYELSTDLKEEPLVPQQLIVEVAIGEDRADPFLLCSYRSVRGDYSKPPHSQGEGGGLVHDKGTHLRHIVSITQVEKSYLAHGNLHWEGCMD